MLESLTFPIVHRSQLEKNPTLKISGGFYSHNVKRSGSCCLRPARARNGALSEAQWVDKVNGKQQRAC